jgi:hypothetical protein
MTRHDTNTTRRAGRLARPARLGLVAGACVGLLALASGCGAGHGSSSTPAAPAAAASNPTPGSGRGVAAAAQASQSAGASTSKRSPFQSGNGTPGPASNAGPSSAQQSADVGAIEQDLTVSGTAASQAASDLNAAAAAQAQNDNP